MRSYINAIDPQATLSDTLALTILSLLASQLDSQWAKVWE